MAAATTMLFVDGENLWLRYQAMCSVGFKPWPDNIIIGNCFVWNHRILANAYWNLRRISYHTSMYGGDEELREVREAIAKVRWQVSVDAKPAMTRMMDSVYSSQMVPVVRKKSRKSNKESICDIAITVDVMRACYRDHAQTIFVISGDGDFCKLFEEVMHSGKTAYAGALSNGLHPSIPISVDEFFNLDGCFFDLTPQLIEDLEKVKAL